MRLGGAGGSFRADSRAIPDGYIGFKSFRWDQADSNVASGLQMKRVSDGTYGDPFGQDIGGSPFPNGEMLCTGGQKMIGVHATEYHQTQGIGGYDPQIYLSADLTPICGYASTPCSI